MSSHPTHSPTTLLSHALLKFYGNQCLDFAKIPEWHNGLIESVERLDGSLRPLEAGDQLRYRSGGVTGNPTVVVGFTFSSHLLQIYDQPGAGCMEGCELTQSF